MKEYLLNRSWIDETILLKLEVGLMKEFLVEQRAQAFYTDETNTKTDLSDPHMNYVLFSNGRWIDESSAVLK